MNITILGAGAFGKALGKILTDNDHSVNYYDPAIFPNISLDLATRMSDVIVVAIPSEFLADFLKDYPNNLKTKPTILASKGLFNADLFADFTQFSVLSGPAFAGDIIEGKAITMTASSPFAHSVFSNEQATIELCEDITGILLCGSLKNIYAIGAGYREASGDNIEEYINEAHTEMADYLERHGAERTTADLSCGIDDLRLTCSESSRNFRFGKRLQAGESPDSIIDDLKTVEGYTALQVVDKEGYPLINQVQNIILQNNQK